MYGALFRPSVTCCVIFFPVCSGILVCSGNISLFVQEIISCLFKDPCLFRQFLKKQKIAEETAIPEETRKDLLKKQGFPEETRIFSTTHDGRPNKGSVDMNDIAQKIYLATWISVKKIICRSLLPFIILIGKDISWIFDYFQLRDRATKSVSVVFMGMIDVNKLHRQNWDMKYFLCVNSDHFLLLANIPYCTGYCISCINLCHFGYSCKVRKAWV